tara:strand:+ start:846 stop:1295 length:450 start_codon:yes stop_codon:yes gene_type:complete
VKVSKFFRYWFYFRIGWSQYFAFIFAAVNTLTVTYFLAVENYPILNTIFPTFVHYIVIMVLAGVPTLLLIGYAHFKRTEGFKAEADVSMESNPHMKRILDNSEKTLEQHFQLTELLIKFGKSEKMSSDELAKVKQIQDELTEYIKKKTM